MKLKRVRILGFKTFADKTEFDLDGDIVAVVGPNGCGKSNIVDAVLWCLGETSPKAIRAQTGKEVIFAGSAHRKPHGFAEVRLHFDNEDGTLPIDSPEVSVTRRVDRTGQGDYEINSRSCRLKDVGDLLADSGLGRAGYAIVGQSEIDQALAASPQQRRAWIDEAAGVHRYRVRRQEAVRRLDSTQQHLQRVRDVLTELDNQREPLAAEAEVAIRYRSALKSLRQVECGLLVKELATVVAELGVLETHIDQAARLVANETKLATQAETEAKHAHAQAERLQAEAEVVRGKLQAARALVDQTQSTLDIARARLESLDVLESNLFAEATASQDRLAHAEADAELAREELISEESAFEALEQDVTGVGDEAEALKADLDAAEQVLAEARLLLAQRQRNELELLHREQRASEVKKELEGAVAAVPDLLIGVEDAETALAELESTLEEHLAAGRLAEESLAELEARESTSAEETRKLLSALAATDGRRRGIEATIEAHEGLSQGAKAVLGLLKKGELKGTYVPVGDCVSVDADLALAIDTALGAASNDLIVPDEEHAKRAIALLKEQCLGRATFQPVSRMRPEQHGRDSRTWTKEKGFIGFAHDLVDCEPGYRPVIDSLLSNVVVVETIDDALRLPRSRDWKRCVILEGDLIHASGAVTGGRAVRQTSGLVQRQADLAETVAELGRLQKKIALAEAEATKRRDQASEIYRTRASAQDAAKAVRKEVEEAKTWLHSLRNELNSVQRAEAKLRGELDQLTSDTSQTLPPVDVENAEEARDLAWKRLTARNADAEAASQRLREGRERLETAKRRLVEAERRLESAKQADAHRLSRADSLEPERARQRTTIAQAESALKVYEEEVVTLQAKLDQLLEGRRLASQQSQDLVESAQRARKAASDAETAAYQHEIKKARLEGKRAAALERLLDEYGVNEDTALEQAPTTVVPPDASSLVNRLRRELKDMGEVNLGAIEAFERLSQRYDELNGQAMDIETGMTEIQDAIDELDRLTKEKFTETFAKVREAFGQTFKRVFGGGEGVLSLIGGATDLDAGVDIQVTIPGKKQQRLELLSGGERALSALAFLFALLKVKPSPLVILDEVDAPLDGRNVERFVGLMRDFSDQTQFILVTHNPITIESADVWFGVTMQEPGVSTLVPFKVPDKTVVKAVVPDVYLKG